jgi:hypothetical protein
MLGFSFRSSAGLLLTLFLTASIIGCGPKTARISGKVLLNGEPMPRTDIQFVPKADESKNFRGVGLADGSYQIDYGRAGEMPVGDYLAKVTIYRTRRGEALPDGEAGEAMKSSGQVVIRRYVLEFPVTESSSSFDLDLDKAKLEPDEQ